MGQQLTLTLGTSLLTVTQVQFYVNDRPIGSGTVGSGGWQKAWTPQLPGRYRIKARGTLTDLSTLESPEVNLIVIYGEGKHIWHSYNANLAGKTVSDASGNQAALLFYESADDDGVEHGSPYASFHSGAHPRDWNNVQPYWTPGAGVDYPYVGSYTVERPAPPVGTEHVLLPAGVNDRAVYPPNNQHLSVVAFVVPEAGNYRVPNLGVKKTVDMGYSASLKLFDPDRTLLATIQAQPAAGSIHTWYYDETVYELDSLQPGDRIYFALDMDADSDNDFCVLTFTVVKTGQ